MAINDDSTGPDEQVVEGSWSPRRSKPASARKARTEGGKTEAAAPQDPEVLVDQIEKTREELAETLDAIAEKVSPKRVVSRTSKKVGDAVKDGTTEAVDSVKETATDAAQAVKGGVAAVKEKVEPEPEPASTPGALADAASTPVEPVGAETPSYASTLPPRASSRMPLFAGAGVALLVLLFVWRRRRR